MPKRRKSSDTPTLHVCWSTTGRMIEVGDYSQERIAVLRRLFEGR